MGGSMKSSEFINEISSEYVNNTIRTNRNWRRQGRGATASVWQHISDPHTVVKVVGGGEMEDPNDLGATIAFVHFCVDHGYKSKHFPIIHGINVDDPEVVQVRIEKLQPLNFEVASALSGLANAVGYSCFSASSANLNSRVAYLEKMLQQKGLQTQNNADDMVDAIRMLGDEQTIAYYGKEHSSPYISLDLHQGNWMMRQDGTIVAVDPWVG